MKEKSKGITRRSLIKGLAASAGVAASSCVPGRQEFKFEDPSSFKGIASITDSDQRIIHSVCLGCNARCGNRAFIKEGRLVSISGNPFHPYNAMGHPIPYETPVLATISMPSPVCAKAKDAYNYIYSPYRITKPLKRCGPRGSGQFEPIEWDQLIREIAFGGRLFSHLGEDRMVPGLKDLDCDDPIVPEAPELGPKRNGFVFMTGRLQTGRKAFIDRFVKASFGSINRIGHTDICGLGFRMGNYVFTEGKQVEMKADPWSAKYILVFGANIYEALQPGLNTYGAILAKRHAQGDVIFSIVDPRAQKACVHAEEWIPVKPGFDGAFAMGMIRWMIDHKAYNRRYLEAPNRKAALRLGNNAYVNATHLVICDHEHPNNGKFLRLGDLDAQTPRVAGHDSFVVISKGTKALVPYDSVESAVLDFDGEISDSKGKRIKVKTAFRIMKEGILEHDLPEYASYAGVKEDSIKRVAKRFSSFGPRAAVCQYHGAGNYPGGTYASLAVSVLNALVGSVERKGGFMSAGSGLGTWKKGTYDLENFPGKRRPRGVRISREKATYEKSTEFRKKLEETGSGYPARRPWFPFTKGGLSVEALCGIDQGYPYKPQVLFTYFFNPVYSAPGGYRFKDTLKDPARVPLFVSIDVGINETNLYADYIVPDVTYAEGHYGWIFPHAPALKFTALRTPLIEPLTGETREGRHMSLETFLIDLAVALDLPGFGPKAIPVKDGNLLELQSPEDFYLRGFSNIVENAGLEPASQDEIDFVERNYPAARFRSLLEEDKWYRLCRALARGGLFQDYEKVFDGEVFTKGLKRVVLYNEKLALTRDSLTGQLYHGSLKFWPGPAAKNDDEAESSGFQMISHKMSIHTQSRTIWHNYAMELAPSNFVCMHPQDAEKIGLKPGDMVRLTSKSNKNGVLSKLRLTSLIRRGVVAIQHHYGHSQLGASRLRIKQAKDVFLGGESVTDQSGLVPDASLGQGINPNDLSELDDVPGRTPMVDRLGGIPDFSSTRVQVFKV